MMDFFGSKVKKCTKKVYMLDDNFLESKGLKSPFI